MSSEKNYSSGIGFPGLLTLVFITLKLCKVIDWPWIFVLAPMWVVLLIVIIIVIVEITLKSKSFRSKK